MDWPSMRGRRRVPLSLRPRLQSGGGTAAVEASEQAGAATVPSCFSQRGGSRCWISPPSTSASCWTAKELENFLASASNTLTSTPPPPLPMALSMGAFKPSSSSCTHGSSPRSPSCGTGWRGSSGRVVSAVPVTEMPKQINWESGDKPPVLGHCKPRTHIVGASVSTHPCAIAAAKLHDNFLMCCGRVMVLH